MNYKSQQIVGSLWLSLWVCLPTSTAGYTIYCTCRYDHQPIMGEVEFNGKTIKTEVVPIGAFTLVQGEDKVYSNGITFRVFAQRQQWQRWNSETEEMEKSV